ncbi:MAG: GspE/PulE family protein [Erysipelotrichaceae bacterium]
MRKNIRLGEVLIEQNKISEIQLQIALNKQKEEPGKRLGDILIELNMISERDMLSSLAKRLNLEFSESLERSIDIETTKFVNETLVRKSNVVPLYIKNGVLYVATSDPLNFYAIDDVAMASGFDVRVIVASHSDVQGAIERLYTKAQAKTAMDTIFTEFGDFVDTVQVQAESDSATKIDSSPIVQLVNSIIKEAAQQNASDIHIEPLKYSTNVRFRIDGDLIAHTTLTSNTHDLLSTRIKIMGGMNIAEKRQPLDGGFTMDLGDRKIDIRVSTLPTIYGEKVVMRLLGNDQSIDYRIDAIGFSEKNLALVKRTLLNTNGVILVSGPTGSGKTTTSYAILQEIAKPSHNVVSVEDPVEKAFDNMNQVQINEKSGLTFAKGLRSILRQDPDVILIGEIRDEETAGIAIKAAITGHLVLSTIHTNDSVSTVSRLVDMGVEPYLLSSALRSVISQRLVKRLCPHCKTSAPISEDKQAVLQTQMDEVMVPVGCEKCNHTGYKGRIGLYEVLTINNQLAGMISRGRQIDEIREVAIQQGLTTLKDEAVRLLQEKETSYEEVIRIVYSVE